MESPEITGQTSNQHIIMFPFMAQGHLIPFLSLAKLISNRFSTITIHFINTPLNIQSLSNSLPSNSYPNIHFHSLPFRSSDFDLPPGVENTNSISTPLLILKLFQVSESLKPQFTSFVSELTLKIHENNSRILIVADVFFGWTVDIARELHLPHVSFTTCGAYGTAVYFNLWLHLPFLKSDLPEFRLPGFPDDFKIHKSQLSSYMRAADGTDPWSRFFKAQISGSLKSDAMLCYAVEELEVKGLRLLRETTGMKIWAVGPLLPLDSNSIQTRSGKRYDVAVEEIMEWLDSKPVSSVVYVSFGSQNTVSSSQMMNLAIGLEESGHPFVWVIRPPVGFDLKADLRPEWLPDGFERRMKEKKQGLLVKGWAPQLEILSHEATGAFLSHCGWNSVMESLSRGVAVIGWPLASEQFYNSKMIVEELGVGVEVARGVVTEVGSEEVERVVKLVMEEERGKEMKKKAMRCREIIRESMMEEGDEKGSSLMAVDDFIASMMTVNG